MGPVRERRRIELPHPRERRVEQPQPPVAGEHRDSLGEIVEGLALHPHLRLVAPAQLQRLGDVVVEIGHAAFGIGRGDDAQRAAARQMPFVGGGFGRAIGLVQLGLPLAEVVLLRQPPRVAQPVEHGGVARPLVEEGGVEVPQRAEGGVVEDQSLVGAEHGDSGGEVIERGAMRVDHALELGAHGLGFGGVDGDAGGAAPGREGRARRTSRRPPATIAGSRPLNGCSVSCARWRSARALRSNSSMPRWSPRRRPWRRRRGHKRRWHR